MSFSADCWIQVKDAEGKVLATGVKKSGHQFSVSGKAPYSVILGAPEGVTMEFDGEAVDLSGYTSGKVARFKLP
jgi:cytoskeleton protein RodZ